MKIVVTIKYFHLDIRTFNGVETMPGYCFSWIRFRIKAVNAFNWSWHPEMSTSLWLERIKVWACAKRKKKKDSPSLENIIHCFYWCEKRKRDEWNLNPSGFHFNRLWNSLYCCIGQRRNNLVAKKENRWVVKLLYQNKIKYLV